MKRLGGIILHFTHEALCSTVDTLMELRSNNYYEISVMSFLPECDQAGDLIFHLVFSE